MAGFCIEVDGNDGTGKTTLARLLRERGYTVVDRGLATLLTDEPAAAIRQQHITNPGTLIIILDCEPVICQERILAAGRSLTERYHNLADLLEYRERFRAIAEVVPNAHLVDCAGAPLEVLTTALCLIHSFSPR